MLQAAFGDLLRRECGITLCDGDNRNSIDTPLFDWTIREQEGEKGQVHKSVLNAVHSKADASTSSDTGTFDEGAPRAQDRDDSDDYVSMLRVDVDPRVLLRHLPPPQPAVSLAASSAVGAALPAELHGAPLGSRDLVGGARQQLERAENGANGGEDAARQEPHPLATQTEIQTVATLASATAPGMVGRANDGGAGVSSANGRRAGATTRTTTITSTPLNTSSAVTLPELSPPEPAGVLSFKLNRRHRGGDPIVSATPSRPPKLGSSTPDGDDDGGRIDGSGGRKRKGQGGSSSVAPGSVHAQSDAGGRKRVRAEITPEENEQVRYLLSGRRLD